MELEHPGITLRGEDGRIQYTTYRVSRFNLARMRTLKERLGFSSYDSLISFMIGVVNREGVIPPASSRLVMRDSAPVIVTGEPGSGKTFFVRSLIEAHPLTPVFTIDVHREYQGLKRVDLGGFFSLDWGEDGRYRFTPHSNVEVSRAEVDSVLRHLNMVKQTGILRNWMIVVEEAHRFHDLPSLRSFIVEARKFTRKLLVVCTDWKLFEGLGRIVKPPPWGGET